MKHVQNFVLTLAVLLTPNLAYYAFSWLINLKRQINAEHFLQLPLYVDYIPEAVILLLMSLLIAYAARRFTRDLKYGYILAPAVLLVNLAINSAVFMSVGAPQYFGIGYTLFQWYRAVAWFFIIGSAVYGAAVKKSKRQP